MKGKKQKLPQRNLRDLLYGVNQEKLTQGNPFAIDNSESKVGTPNENQMEDKVQNKLSKHPQMKLKTDSLDMEVQSLNYRNKMQIKLKKVEDKRRLAMRQPGTSQNSFRDIIPKETQSEIYIPQLNDNSVLLNQSTEMIGENNFDEGKDSQIYSPQITKKQIDEQEQYIKENNLTLDNNQQIELNENNLLLGEDQMNYFFSLPPVENLLWEHTFPEEQGNLNALEFYSTPGKEQEVSNIELDPNNLFKNTHFEQPAQRIYLSQQPIAQEHKSILKYPHYLEEKKNSFNKSINMSDFINFDYTLSNKKSQKSIKELNNSNKNNNNDEASILKSNTILDDLPNQFNNDTERQVMSNEDQEEHLILTEQQNDELDDNLEMNELDENSIIDSGNDRLNSSINYDDNDVYSLNSENNNRLNDVSDNTNSLYGNDSNLDENWEEFKNEMGYKHSELSQDEDNITPTPLDNSKDIVNNNDSNSEADSDAELWDEFKNSINYNKNIGTNSFDESNRTLKANINLSQGKNTFDSDDEDNSDPDYEENFNDDSDTSVNSYTPSANHQNELNDFNDKLERSTPNNNLNYTQLEQQNLFNAGIYSNMSTPNNLNNMQLDQGRSKYNSQGNKNFIKNKNIVPTKNCYNNFNDMDQGLERTDTIETITTKEASSLVENVNSLNKNHINTPVSQNTQKKSIVNTYFTPKYGGVEASKLRFQGLGNSNLEKEFMNDYTDYLNDPKFFNNKSLLSSKAGVNNYKKDNNVLTSNQNIQKLDTLFRDNQSLLSSKVIANDSSNQSPNVMNNINKRRGNNTSKVNVQNKHNNNGVDSDEFLRQDILNSNKVKVSKNKQNQTAKSKNTELNHKTHDDNSKPNILPKQTLYDKIAQPDFRYRNSIRENDYNDYDEIDYDAILKPTPIIKSFKLSMLLGCDVLLKLENSSPGQTHKVRGILEWVCEMTRLNGIPFNRGKINFVVSGSVNKCLATIAAVQLFNYNIERIKNDFMFSDPLSITVIVPNCITNTMLRKMQVAYVTIVKLGQSWEGNHGLAEDYVQKIERDNWNKKDEQDEINLAVPNTTHPLITNGLVNIGKELAYQLKGATPDVILCPVGSGNLLAGLVEGLHKSIRMVGVPIIAVETQSTDLLHKHILADKMLPIRKITHSSVASLNESKLNFGAFKACLKHPVIPLIVSDHMAENAATLFSDDHAMRVESASGAAFSPIYHDLITKLIPNLNTKSTVVIIVTGGNILEKKNYDHPIIQAKSLEETYFEYQDNFKVLSDKTYIPENCTTEEQRKRASLIRKIDNYTLDKKREGNTKRTKRKKDKLNDKQVQGE